MAIVTTQSGTGTVNLRTTASTVGAAIAQLPVGSRVTVLSDDGSWCRVQWDGLEGYDALTSFATRQDAQALAYPFSHGIGRAVESSSPSESRPPCVRRCFAAVASQLVYLRRGTENSASVCAGLRRPLTVYSQTGEWCGGSRLEGGMGYLPRQLSAETSSETRDSQLFARPG